ncbi:hypothetical protein AAFF_G00106730 [Aldrovandia affinis]|uniref:Uncharacterized protein n=1 Tax=Aldrovandia affinis TaxID=143900 RepID=A0AAD7T441_9TELE|nr:hypothetical protein AAFF_G00106730 [Aldrovandia affinis]
MGSTCKSTEMAKWTDPLSRVLTHAYIKDNCSFVERILPNGYNVYLSDTHGAGVSLGGVRPRLGARARCLRCLSHFLPMPSTLARVPEGANLADVRSPGNASQEHQWPVDTESMDPIGVVSQTVIQSPSLDKR